MTYPLRKPKVAAGLTLALAASLALAACSSNSTSGPRTGVGSLDPDTKVSITWWTGQDDEAEQILEGLAKDYEADHPNVTVDVSAGAATTDDLLQKLQAGFAASSYPDISDT